MSPARNRDYPGKVYPEDRGTVHLHSTKRRYPTTVIDLVDDMTRVETHDTLPAGWCDLFLAKGRVDRSATLAAARFHAVLVTLPEAEAWLARYIHNHTSQGRDVRAVVYDPSTVY